MANTPLPKRLWGFPAFPTGIEISYTIPVFSNLGALDLLDLQHVADIGMPVQHAHIQP